MRASVALTVGLLLLGSACRGNDEVMDVQLPALDSRDLQRAALSLEDVGEGWETVEGSRPNTIQIGGDVGAANVTNPVAAATTAFRHTEGPGRVSNTVYLMASDGIAGEVIEAHRDVADQDTWIQEREDGGTTTFANAGALTDLSGIGDEAFTARLEVKIRAGSGQETDRVVEYVVFRDGPIVSFLAAQDAPAAPFATTHAAKIDDALATAPTAPADR